MRIGRKGDGWTIVSPLGGTGEYGCVGSGEACIAIMMYCAEHTNVRCRLGTQGSSTLTLGYRRANNAAFARLEPHIHAIAKGNPEKVRSLVGSNAALRI